MEHYPTHPTPEDRGIPSYLEYYSDDELVAYEFYLNRTGKPDCERTALEFEGDFWGSYDSISQFCQNWDYQAEPLDAVQSLLVNNPEVAELVTLPELALIDRLSDDMEVIIRDNHIYIFNKPNTAASDDQEEPC